MALEFKVSELTIETAWVELQRMKNFINQLESRIEKLEKEREDENNPL